MFYLIINEYCILLLKFVLCISFYYGGNVIGCNGSYIIDLKIKDVLFDCNLFYFVIN